MNFKKFINMSICALYLGTAITCLTKAMESSKEHLKGGQKQILSASDKKGMAGKKAIIIEQLHRKGKSNDYANEYANLIIDGIKGNNI